MAEEFRVLRSLNRQAPADASATPTTGAAPGGRFTVLKSLNRQNEAKAQRAGGTSNLAELPEKQRQSALKAAEQILGSNAPDDVKAEARKILQGGGGKSKSLLGQVTGGIGSAFGEAFGLLDKPRAAVVSGIKEGIDLLDSDPETKASLGDFRTQVTGSDPIGFGDLVSDTDLPQWLKVAVGFTGDVALDPLTYLAPQTKIAQAAKLGKPALANKILREGVDKIGREGAEDAATRVARDGISALTKDELRLLLGAEGGLHINMPGTGRLARAVTGRKAGATKQARILPYDVTRPVGQATRKALGGVRDTRVGTAVARSIGDDFELRQLARSGDPERAPGAIAALGEKRLGVGRASALEQKWVKPLAGKKGLLRPFRSHRDDLRQALEGDAQAASRLEGAGLGAQLAGVRTWLDSVRAEANEAGLQIGRLEDYFPHFLTDEAAKSTKVGARAAKGRATPEFYRSIRAAGEFLGEPLEAGSVDEIDRIGKTVLGDDYVKLFRGDPLEVLPAYARVVAHSMGRNSTVQSLLERGAISPSSRALGARGEALGAREALGAAEGAAPVSGPQERLQANLARILGREADELTAEADSPLARMSPAEFAETQAKVADFEDLAGRLAQGGNALAEARRTAGINRRVKRRELKRRLGKLFGKGSTFEGNRTPNPVVDKAAADYTVAKGLPKPRPIDPALKVDDEFASRIAAAYDDLPVDDSANPAVRAAYVSMVEDVDEQYRYLTDTLGVKVEFVDDDPYRDAADMMEDVLVNGRLKVFKTAEDQLHPFMSPDQNDQFRAVHDFFGHSAAGNRFDRHGEEIAFRKHAQMFRPESVPAMATETRGQNAFLNYHPDNLARRARNEQAEFPPQKTALLPEWAYADALGQAADNADVGALAANYFKILDLLESGKIPVELRDEVAAKIESDQAMFRQLGAGGVDRASIQALVDGTAAGRIGEAEQRGQEALSLADELRRESGPVTSPKIQRLQAQVDEQRPVFDQMREALGIADSDPAEALGRLQADIDLTEARITSATTKPNRAELLRQANEKRRRAQEFLRRSSAATEQWERQVGSLRAQAEQAEAKMLDFGWKPLDADVVAGRLASDDAGKQARAMIADARSALAHGSVDEQTAEILQALDKVSTREGYGALLRSFDRFTNWWKALAVTTPGFHFRNSFGGFFNNHLAGVDFGAHRRWLKTNKQYGAGKLTGDDERIVRKIHESGILTGGQTAHEVEQALIASPLSKVGPGANNAILRGNRAQGEKVENMLRGALAFDMMSRKGMAVDEAVAMVDKFHFDYGNLSQFERNIGKRVVPFWTWTSRNLPLQLEMLARKPGAYAKYVHAKTEIENVSPEDEVVPSYFKELMGIRLPFDLGEGRAYATPDLPFVSAAEMGAHLQDPVRLLADANPLIKAPLEAHFDEQFFAGLPLRQEKKAVPSMWDNIPGLMPALAVIGRATTDKDGGWLMSDEDAHLVEQFIPVLARTRRLAPNEKRYQDRALTSWLSTVFGVGLRTNTPTAQWGELKNRTDELTSLRKLLEEQGYAVPERR